MSLSVEAVDIKKRIESCKNLQEVEDIRLEYLGKKGLIPSEMKLLGKLSIDERKLKGQELNKLKSMIEDAIDNQKTFIQNVESPSTNFRQEPEGGYFQESKRYGGQTRLNDLPSRQNEFFRVYLRTSDTLSNNPAPHHHSKKK